MEPDIVPKDMITTERDLPRTRAPLLRKPEATDGAAIWDLVRACKPLDENSMYANLIQADHFRDTCVLAELDDEVGHDAKEGGPSAQVSRASGALGPFWDHTHTSRPHFHY